MSRFGMRSLNRLFSHFFWFNLSAFRLASPPGGIRLPPEGDPCNLYDPRPVPWVGCVLYRSCTTSHSGRLGSVDDLDRNLSDVSLPDDLDRDLSDVSLLDDLDRDLYDVSVRGVQLCRTWGPSRKQHDSGFCAAFDYFFKLHVAVRLCVRACVCVCVFLYDCVRCVLLIAHGGRDKKCVRPV